MGAASNSPRWCCCWHCWCATSSAHGDTATGGDALLRLLGRGSRGAHEERHTATSWEMAAIRLADALRMRANSVRVMMFLLGSPRVIARWCGGFSGQAVGQSQAAPAPFTERCCTSQRRRSKPPCQPDRGRFHPSAIAYAPGGGGTHAPMECPKAPCSYRQGLYCPSPTVKKTLPGAAEHPAERRQNLHNSCTGDFGLK